MKALAYLCMRKAVSLVRNQFRTLSTGLILMLTILIYGGFLVMSFVMSKNLYTETMRYEVTLALMLGVGMAALFAFAVMFSKRKALVYETDAFYLFAGPFTRKQANAYVLVQSFFQGILYGALSAFMAAVFLAKSYLTVWLFLLCIVVFWLTITFFLVLNDYIYMWSLVKKQYKIWLYLVPVAVLGAAAAVFCISALQNGFQIKESAWDFLFSREFYFVPFFGWAKWTLVSFVEGRAWGVLAGLLLLFLANGAVSFFFLRFDKEIVEQVVLDAEEVSAYVKAVRARGGTAGQEKRKIKAVKGSFREGGWAILSKNMLLLKKTGNFLTKQELFIIVLYFVLSIVILPENSFQMFCYMMFLWLVSAINDSDFMRDLKNYQIYLIPDHPFKKLVSVVLPTLFKLSVVTGAAILFAGIFNRMPPGQLFSMLATVIGYCMVFAAGTVLSVRLMGSRSNLFVENLLRMVMIVLAAVPSVLILIPVVLFVRETAVFYFLLPAVTVVMNFGVLALTLAGCQGMMNGKEL